MGGTTLQTQKNEIISTLSSLLLSPTMHHRGSFIAFCLGSFNYVLKELFSLYIPFGTVALLCLVSLILYLIDRVMKRRKGERQFKLIEWKKRSLINRSTTALVGALLLAYSGILSSCLKLFFCVEVRETMDVQSEVDHRADRAWNMGDVQRWNREM